MAPETQTNAELIRTRSFSLSPSPADILPPLDSAQQSALHSWDECVRRASIVSRSATMVIAYYGWRIAKSNRWSEFGVADESAYAAARDIPASSWKRCLRIGRTLESLTFEQLCAISVSNAHALTEVVPDIWFDYPWLDEARSLSRTNFIPLVRERNRIFTGHAPHKMLNPRKTRSDKGKGMPEPSITGTPDPLASIVDLPSSASADLLAASRHTYKLMSLVIRSMRKRIGQSSPKLKDDLRILLKARDRISGGIRHAVSQSQSQPTQASS